MKTHSAPYVPLTKTRAEIAEHIAAGFPPHATYATHRETVVSPCPGVTHRTYEPVPLPIHLRRA